MNEPTEQLRRERQAEITAEAGSRESLETRYGQVWSTAELTEDFEVIGFAAPHVVVRRKAPSGHADRHIVMEGHPADQDQRRTGLDQPRTVLGSFGGNVILGVENPGRLHVFGREPGNVPIPKCGVRLAGCSA